jgi:predicted transcriptional regulator of viral defense system
LTVTPQGQAGTVNRAVDRIASRQHSLITTAQLLQSGLNARQIERFQGQGALQRLRRGVYRLAGAAPTWHQSVHAAVLGAGTGAVISHTTAAANWQLFHAERYQRGGIHLTAARQLRLRGVTSHICDLTADQITVHERIPTTTAERTVVDLAGFLTVDQLGQCLDDALRRDLIHLERFRRLVATIASRPANDWERHMDELWDQLGLESAVRQHRVRVEGHTYIIDRAIPDLKIGAEYNGHRYHSRSSDVDRDVRRMAELAAHGWHIVPVTPATKPHTFKNAIERVVNDRQTWMRPQPDGPQPMRSILLPPDM